MKANDEQLKAADALLDIGVSVPLRPVRFRKWKRTPRVTIKRPPLGGLLRILRVWIAMDTDTKQLNAMSESERLTFIAANGQALSKMVALMVCSGSVSGRVLAPLMAWVLRWRCHPDTLLYAALTFMNLQDTKSFTSIIASVESINVLEPAKSQGRKRS